MATALSPSSASMLLSLNTKAFKGAVSPIDTTKLLSLKRGPLSLISVTAILISAKAVSAGLLPSEATTVARSSLVTSRSTSPKT